MATEATTVEAANRSRGPHKMPGMLASAFLALLASLFPSAGWADEPPSNSGVGLTLTNAIQIRRLPVEAASHAKPVRLRGVVTYADFEWNMLFIQDLTAGIFVSQS